MNHDFRQDKDSIGELPHTMTMISLHKGVGAAGLSESTSTRDQSVSLKKLINYRLYFLHSVV